MQRITSIDSFRGVMLFLMTLTHLFIFSFISIDWLKPYVYGSLGFFTDAEGFFFLSGLVAGMVYGRMFLEGKSQQATARILQRVKQMYFWQMALFSAVALALLLSKTYVQNCRMLHEIVDVWIGKEGIHFFIDHPLQAVGLGCCFLYLPPFLDLLPMYIFFLVATPFVLRQLKEGRVRLVAAVSIGLWITAQFIPPRILEMTFKMYLPSVKLGWFDLLAWQLLFVTGLMFGYLKIAGRLPKPPRFLVVLSSLLTILFFCLKHWGPLFPIAANLYELGFLRILSFSAIACTVWAYHRWLTFRLFAFLGKYSLQVFLYHCALLYFLIFFQYEITSLTFFSKILLMACCTLSLWVPAYICERRRQLRSIAPA